MRLHPRRQTTTPAAAPIASASTSTADEVREGTRAWAISRTLLSSTAETSTVSGAAKPRARVVDLSMLAQQKRPIGMKSNTLDGKSDRAQLAGSGRRRL